MPSGLDPAALTNTVAHTSTDVFVLIAGVVACMIWAYLAGREVLIATIFATYPTMLMLEVFPYEKIPGSLSGVSLRALVALIAMAALYVVVRRRLSNAFFVGGVWRAVEVVVLSVGTVGVVVTLLYHGVGVGTVYQFSDTFTALFLSPTAEFSWLVGPLLSMPLVIRS